MEIVSDYDLQPHHLKLLEAACRCWDRLTEAQVRVRADGAYVAGHGGVLRTHPAVVVEKDCRVQFCRILREADLDGTPEPDPRPPRR